MAPPRSAVAQKLREQDSTLLPSEDESDDSDFALSDSELARNGDAGSSSSSSSSSGSDDEPGRDKAKKPTTRKKKNEATKKKRAAEEPVAPPAPPAAPVVDVDDLWAQFNAQDDDPYAPKPSTSTSAMTPTTTTTTNGNGNGNGNGKGKGKAKADNQDEHDLVTIQIEYEFAGEKVQQQKKVKRSSAEAQAYFARNPTAGARKAAPLPPPKKDPTSASLDALFGPDESTLNPALASSTTEAAPVPPLPAAAAGPAPKRRKVGGGGGLAGVAASLGVGLGGKPAKLNTLEKSKLDWTSYVSSETGLEDTLAHARKDGYLDRRDFLDRVDQSKEEQWDKARQAGRRR